MYTVVHGRRAAIHTFASQPLARSTSTAHKIGTAQRAMLGARGWRALLTARLHSLLAYSSRSGAEHWRWWVGSRQTAECNPRGAGAGLALAPPRASDRGGRGPPAHALGGRAPVHLPLVLVVLHQVQRSLA